MAQLKQAAPVVPTNVLTVFPDHEQHSLSEHEELRDALADHAADSAREIAERHVLEAGRSLIDCLDRHATTT